MGNISSPAPVLAIFAAFSRYGEAIDWAAERAAAALGPIALRSEPYAFVETDYYQESMGAELKKCFWAHETLVDPARLAELKHMSNRWEEEYAALGRHPEPRPLNLDPGYVTPAKLVLASTKDHAHRMYLTDGIFAEVTLFYRDRAWQAREWTFPDYRRADVQEFFTRARGHLMARLREAPPA